jgi:uncharacterized RDD family membrane protein YckC
MAPADRDPVNLPIHVSIEHLERDQVAMLEMLLGSEGVAYLLTETSIAVRPDGEPAARRLVGSVEKLADVYPAWFDSVPHDGPKVAGMPIASAAHRLAGGVADSVGVRMVTLLGVALGASLFTMLIWEALYWILFTALGGRTLGKRLAGTRVITSRGGRVGLPAAIVRYLVPSAGAWTGWAIGTELDSDDTATVVIGSLLLLWPVVVYGLMLLDDKRRGLHDRLAGTIVVQERRRRPR